MSRIFIYIRMCYILYAKKSVVLKSLLIRNLFLGILICSTNRSSIPIFVYSSIQNIVGLLFIHFVFILVKRSVSKGAFRARRRVTERIKANEPTRETGIVYMKVWVISVSVSLAQIFAAVSKKTVNPLTSLRSKIMFSMQPFWDYFAIWVCVQCQCDDGG